MNVAKSLLAVWLLAIILGAKLDPWHERQFLPPPESQTADDVLVDVFGEIKTVVARYLWFRMDMFHEALDDQKVAADKQKEVLPLLRMVTLLDPSMTDSYDQIVWDLYKGHHKVKEARELLLEGIRKNPKAWDLRFRSSLIEYLEKNYDRSLEDAALGLPYATEEFDRLNTLRLIYWSAKELKRTEIQRQALQDIVVLRPDDPIWKREFKTLEPMEKPRVPVR